MKSTILSLLLFAALALAGSVCEQRTVTHTEYEKIYETVKAAEVVAFTKSSASSSCSRRTVTATTYEKVYVTVTAEDVQGETTTSTVDVTSTSTLDITTTVTVHPSASAPVSVSSGLYYPTIISPSAEPQYSVQYTPVPLSEAPKPTYESDANGGIVPIPTSKYEAPAESSSAPEAVKEAATSATTSNKGDATFYGGNVAGGMCSFSGYTIPSGIFGTALSDSNWAGASNCGVCVQVTGPSGTKIIAMVVDQCPGCGLNHLDLFPGAFAKLADPSKGVIPVSWVVVPCGITSPIVLKNKEGTSKYWFSMQVQNANVGISKLEVSIDGGATWKATTRKDYNYFENPSGFGTDSVDVKVTSVNGGSIVVKGVSVAASSTKTAGGNLS